MKKKMLLKTFTSACLAGVVTVSSVCGGNMKALAYGMLTSITLQERKITNSNQVTTVCTKNENTMQMQGMCFDNDNKIYMFKTDDNAGDNTANLYCYNLDTKKAPTIIRANSKIVGHANDATYYEEKKNRYIYVATCQTGVDTKYVVPEIACINLDTGKVRKFSVYIGDEHREVSQIAYCGNNGNTPRFVIRLRGENKFYVGRFSSNVTNTNYSGKFIPEETFKLDTKFIKSDICSSFAYGGMEYKNNKLYITIAKKSGENFTNKSYILTYPAEFIGTTKSDASSETLVPKHVDELSHKNLTSTSDKFEIEGVVVKGSNLYFTTNNIKASNKASMNDALYKISK